MIGGILAYVYDVLDRFAYSMGFGDAKFFHHFRSNNLIMI